MAFTAASRPSPALARMFAVPRSGTGLMTLGGTLNKTALLIAVVVLAAPAAAVLPPAVGMVAMLAAFVLGVWGTWRPAAAKYVAVPYAACEGVVLGSVTRLYTSRFGDGLVFYAIAATLAIAAAAVVAYRSGRIRVSSRFARMVLVATIGVAVVYLLTLVLQLAHMHIPAFATHGPFAILIAAAIVALAAANLIVDIDFITAQTRRGAGQDMEWSAALGMAIALVWLYMSVLRLLADLQSR